MVFGRNSFQSTMDKCPNLKNKDARNVFKNSKKGAKWYSAKQ